MSEMLQKLQIEDRPWGPHVDSYNIKALCMFKMPKGFQNEVHAWFQLPPRFRGDFFLKNKNLRGNKNKMLGLRGEISLRGHNDCTFDKILDHHQPHLKQKPKDVLWPWGECQEKCFYQHTSWYLFRGFAYEFGIEVVAGWIFVTGRSLKSGNRQ